MSIYKPQRKKSFSFKGFVSFKHFIYPLIILYFLYITNLLFLVAKLLYNSICLSVSKSVRLWENEIYSASIDDRQLIFLAKNLFFTLCLFVGGLEPVLINTKKLCLTLIYKQLSADI